MISYRQVSVVLITLLFIDLTQIVTADDTQFPVMSPNEQLPRILKRIFDRQVDVFGTTVLATSGVSGVAITHTANTLAEFLDNDEDGDVDVPQVADVMCERRATIMVFVSEYECERYSETLESLFEVRMLQSLWETEIHPDGAKYGRFDATLEEVLHLVTVAGYAEVWPHAFGIDSRSHLARAMDIARGGRFRRIPRRYPREAWFTYDDRTCDYECQMVEYFYWGLTSLQGGQEFPGRFEQIRDEWRLNTPKKLREHDKALHTLLTEPEFSMPMKLPDGRYRDK
ncbi:MAG: hypothetical protein MK102_16565 [Fuerstiella sp.]|nr:hypothetical protein [Fuerstiella sp.]